VSGAVSPSVMCITTIAQHAVHNGRDRMPEGIPAGDVELDDLDAGRGDRLEGAAIVAATRETKVAGGVVRELGEQALRAFDVPGHLGLPDRSQAVTRRVEGPVGVRMACELEERVGSQPPGLVRIPLDPLPGEEHRRWDPETIQLVDRFPIVVGGNLMPVQLGQHRVGHVGVEGERHPGTVPRSLADDRWEPRFRWR